MPQTPYDPNFFGQQPFVKGYQQPVSSSRQPQSYGQPTAPAGGQQAQYQSAWPQQNPVPPTAYPGSQPQAQRYAGAVRPVQTRSADDHADVRYSKGARRGGFWRVLFFLSLIVLLGALSCVGYIFYTYWQGQNEYDELAQEYMQVDDPGGVATLASFNIDWDGLRAINPDVVGWVYVPDTVINYPIVWRENDDNYYLKRTFGDNSVGTFGAEYGTIMLAGVNSSSWTDQVNVIYGHHLNNGSMFALFADMADSSVFNEHREIFVLTPVGNFRMTAFAVDKVAGSSTDIVIPNFQTKEELTAYVQQRLDDSLVMPDPPAIAADKVQQVFAFSTCSQPDHQNRIVTFCSVNEFLPAGSDESKGNSLLDEEEVAEVQEMADERLL